MFRTLGCLVLIIFSTLLISCKSNFVIDVYSSDLFLKDNIDTPALMEFEIPSCSSDRREKFDRDVLAIFDSTSKAKIVGCEKSNLKVSISSEITSTVSSRDVILIRNVVDDRKIEGLEYEGIGLSPIISGPFIQRIKSLLDENWQKLSYKQIKIQVSLHNDEKEDVFVSSENLWVDGIPYQRYENQRLKRREKISLFFSDVMRDLVIRGANPIAFHLYKLK